MNSGDRTDQLELRTLGALLIEVTDIPYGYIYLQGDHPWKKDTLGVLVVTDPHDEQLLESTHPDFVESNGLCRAMQISRAASAVHNAFMQKDNVSWEELVACFNFRYTHSGYLELSDTD